MTPKTKSRIKEFICLPIAEQMTSRNELYKELESYLSECETMEDIEFLNHGANGIGLWFGDCRTIALLGATASRILNKDAKKAVKITMTSTEDDADILMSCSDNEIDFLSRLISLLDGKFTYAGLTMEVSE